MMPSKGNTTWNEHISFAISSCIKALLKNIKLSLKQYKIAGNQMFFPQGKYLYLTTIQPNQKEKVHVYHGCVLILAT
jgi:hypothetical protein